jgi:hypothetical protein
MMILTGAKSQLVYQSALAAPVVDAFLTSETSLELVGGGRRKGKFNLSVPVGLQEIFYMP